MRIAGFDGHDGAPKGANFILSFLCFLDVADAEEAPSEALGRSGGMLLFDVLSDLKNTKSFSCFFDESSSNFFEVFCFHTSGS